MLYNIELTFFKNALHKIPYFILIFHSWINPELIYGVFQFSQDDVFICSDRSALNMTYQDIGTSKNNVQKVASIKGDELIGHFVNNPCRKSTFIPILPLQSVDFNQGTGVFISVPGEYIDDLKAIQDLTNKPKLRQQFPVCHSLLRHCSPIKVFAENYLDIGHETIKNESIGKLTVKESNFEGESGWQRFL